MRGKKETTNWIYRLSHTANCISIGTIFLLMLLTVADVVLRKVFNKGILGTLELSEFMMVVIVFFSLADSELKDRNVKVDLFVRKLSVKKQLLIDLTTKFIGFFLYCLASFAVWKYAFLMKSSGEVSLDLWLPKYPFVFIVAAALVLLSAVLLLRFVFSLWAVRHLWIH